MSTVNRAAQREAFGDALRRRLDDLGWRQQDLAAEVAAAEGRQASLNHSTVSQWMAGHTEPPAARVLIVEQVTGVEPGSLSRLLGYVPADIVPSVTVEAAIDADPRLDNTARRVLKATYRSFVN